MKFSDISKSQGAPSHPPAAAPDMPGIPAAPLPTFSPPPVHAAPFPTEESDAALERRLESEAFTATEVYSEAVAAARQVYKALEDPAAAPSLPVPRETLLKLIAVLKTDNQELLTLADRSAPDNYLFGHVVNVAVFSVRLGLSARLSDEELYLLALGSFLHDIGMVAYLPLVLKPARLSEEEVRQVARHSEDGVKLLSKFPSAAGKNQDVLAQIVGMVHERMEKGSYPKGDMHPLAKIVSVCDMYESLTHMRSWRSRLLPHHVLRVMIEEHERTFEPGVVKRLVEALSLYPPGSFVQLSSGEIGRVVAVNAGLPTRPRVKLLMDGQGVRLPSPRLVNLAVQPILYVAEAVDETKIPTSDQRLMLELKAQRWWVRGL